MTESQIREQLTADAKAVEKRLLSFYPHTQNRDIKLCYDAETYSLLGGGKRIRPFLVLEFCRLFGGDETAALDFACAVEMMHTFSLIHDDLPCMDDDELRRGRPTSHIKFGEATALLAGDSLAIRPFGVIAGTSACSDMKVRAVSALATAAGSDGMIGGQLTDLRGETEKLDLGSLLTLHSLKTGAMIRVSCKLGCIAASVADNDKYMLAADTYASGIGLVFQIIDDILDKTSDAETMGKSVGGDAELNKTTFMTYYTPEAAFEYASKVTAGAKAAIADIPGSELLCDFADYLLNRKK